MGCISFCFGSNSKSSKNNRRNSHESQPSSDNSKLPSTSEEKKDNAQESSQPPVAADHDDKSNKKNDTKTFTFAEMVTATQNFNPANFLGEGGFGKVYKGKLADSNQTVAIKVLVPDRGQGIREFVVEVMTLSLADHPNLVKLIGFCTERNQMILVYEYMPLGSLDAHLHNLGSNREGLDWKTRMKIASGAATGLAYLHFQMKPPMIHRDLKTSNILLDEDYEPKLADFGLAKVGPTGNDTHVSTRVMGTHGYCAPDYLNTGKLTFKSDVYSFGVILLELLTGRKAIDNTKPASEQSLVTWARPRFKDIKKMRRLADPKLKGKYPSKGLFQALAIVAMCLQERPDKRPDVKEVLIALEYLNTQNYEPPIHQAETSTGSGSSAAEPAQGG